MTTASTTMRMPVAFISHGAPTLALEDGPAHRFLRDYGTRLGKPRAILVLSAHFTSPEVTVTASRSPGTIHDFYGFPQALYDLTYPAPGAPELAERISELLSAGDIDVQATASRGVDHGAWIPLLLMYPDADVPVVQLSLDPRRGTAWHYRLGELLRPLRDEGVLIIGSGGATHNLGRLDWDGAATPPDWANAFDEWVATSVAAGRIDDLLHYRERGPHAALNHPTEEHFLPLLCALGASEEGDRRTRVHHSYTYGSLSMDTFEFGSA